MGILLVLVGLVWLGSRVGWFDPVLLEPVMVLVVGIWLVAVSAVKRLDRSSDTKGQEVRREEQ